MKEKARIKWLDVVKFFGIFAIYLGHMGESAGFAYEFVFTYHVPLFFFVSGCIETITDVGRLSENSDTLGGGYRNTITYTIVKAAKNILYPFFFFAIMNIVFSVLRNNCSLGAVWGDMILLAKGSVRNNGIGGSLWFLSCLFVIKAIFAVVKKLKYKVLILAACFGMYYYACKIVFPMSGGQPSLAWNIDSALYYIIFYGIGYAAYPYIYKLFQFKGKSDIIIAALSGLFCGGYSAFLFFGKDLLLWVARISALQTLLPILQALIVIWFQLLVANCCKNVTLFSEIGKNTLYLCGSERIIKDTMTCLLTTCGLNLQMVFPLGVYIYTFILIVLANRFLIPVEKKCILWLQEHFIIFLHRIAG